MFSSIRCFVGAIMTLRKRFWEECQKLTDVRRKHRKRQSKNMFIWHLLEKCDEFELYWRTKVIIIQIQISPIDFNILENGKIVFESKTICSSSKSKFWVDTSSIDTIVLNAIKVLNPISILNDKWIIFHVFLGVDHEFSIENAANFF